MKKITASIEPIDQLDISRFTEWAEASRPLTKMDPEVVGYPRSAIITSRDTEVTAYTTAQALIFIDNFIPKPGLEDRRRRLSLSRIDKFLTGFAAEQSFRELMFTTKDKDYADVACNQGWVAQENMIVLRKKVGSK
jgi:hypothetical protein